MPSGNQTLCLLMYSLLTHNTFGIDANASRFLEYTSVEELKTFIEQGLITAPFLHIGSGSNLLFTKDYEGLILHSGIKSIEVSEETGESVQVRVGAGMLWDDFVLHCVTNRWYGAENLSLIPGEVGASAVQNIGAYGVEVKDLIASVETINIHGEERVYSVEECEYAYRNSIFKRPENKSRFITYVNFRLSKKEHYTLEYGTIRQELGDRTQPCLAAIRQLIITIRQRKLPDPQVLGNAGSFFMNPVVERSQWKELLEQYPAMPYYELPDGWVKIPAGWLIEQCGWKGKSLGRAAVHDKQALVLVNLGGATGQEILALSDAVRKDVRAKFGIDIHPEVNFI